MIKLSKKLVAFCSGLLCINNIYAEIPNHHTPTTFLGPTVRGSYSALNGTTAWSALGEAGGRNFRVGGTGAWQLKYNQDFKLSIEYLWQKITYAFFSGDSSEWVQQGALGFGYRMRFPKCRFKPELDLNGYLAHAPNKNVGPITGVFINDVGVLQTFRNHRQVVGSNAIAIIPGFTVESWRGARFGIDINYDSVRYAKHNQPEVDAKGFGGTIRLTQTLARHGYVDLLASNRRPYNYYYAGVGVKDLQCRGKWQLGIDGAYTVGKTALPTTWDVGVVIRYFFDQPPEAPVPQQTVQTTTNTKQTTTKTTRSTKTASNQTNTDTTPRTTQGAGADPANSPASNPDTTNTQSGNPNATNSKTSNPDSNKKTTGTTTETTTDAKQTTQQTSKKTTSKTTKTVTTTTVTSGTTCLNLPETVVPTDFLEWATNPAVRVPQVLAVVKEDVYIPNPNP